VGDLGGLAKQLADLGGMIVKIKRK
jgi:hypothetical protein